MTVVYSGATADTSNDTIVQIVFVVGVVTVVIAIVAYTFVVTRSKGRDTGPVPRHPVSSPTGRGRRRLARAARVLVPVAIGVAAGIIASTVAINVWG